MRRGFALLLFAGLLAPAQNPYGRITFAGNLTL